MNAHSFGLNQYPQIVALRLDGPLYFASVDHVAARIAALEQLDGRQRTRLISLVDCKLRSDQKSNAISRN